jgi:sulfate permease, SulP family
MQAVAYAVGDEAMAWFHKLWVKAGAAPAEDKVGSNEEPEIDQPELSKLREAVANHLPKRPRGMSIRRDGLAGLTAALANVPDGMASGLLAGVNPIYGLYACMAGPIAAGLFSSSQLMIVTTTSAAALMAGQALANMPFEERDTALFTMVVLVGIFQTVFGLLRLGRLTRFVSYSVMTGFVIGIAVLTILTQLFTVSGHDATGENRVAEAFNLVSNLDEIRPLTLATAILALVLVIVLPRTRLKNSGTLVAIAVPSALVALFQFESIETVRDVGEIPSGFPSLFAPSLSYLTFDVVSGALAISVVILVQGAGVSQSVPNPDGSPRRMSRDFIAQGAANLASGLVRGLPVGGSLSTTALLVLSGAGSRLGSIFAGLWMVAIVLFFTAPVSYVVMPALGALLIYASAKTIKWSNIVSIWAIGWPSILAGGTTFIAMLFLPIQAAVGLGAVLSALLYVYESSNDISVVELRKREDGRIEERNPPKRLAANKVTVLDIYGPLFYAGARTLERLLPEPEEAKNPVVILRLRGRRAIGATLVEVLADYAEKLKAANGRLYLTGVGERAYDQAVQSGKLRLTGPVRAYEVTPIVGDSTREAYSDAQAWLVRQGDASASSERSRSGD